MGMPGEPDLISRATAGDKVAFEALLGPIVAPAARLAYAMLQDRAEAEDVVQEAAVRHGANWEAFAAAPTSNRGSWPSSPTSAEWFAARPGGLYCVWNARRPTDPVQRRILFSAWTCVARFSHCLRIREPRSPCISISIFR